jgi:hypothetical protein
MMSQLQINMRKLVQLCMFLLPSSIICRNKYEKNGVPVEAVAGSTTPLVDKPPPDEEAGYNPFEHRMLAHPTR